jgi:hypothetical protein
MSYVARECTVVTPVELEVLSFPGVADKQPILAALIHPAKPESPNLSLLLHT